MREGKDLAGAELVMFCMCEVTIEVSGWSEKRILVTKDGKLMIHSRWSMTCSCHDGRPIGCGVKGEGAACACPHTEFDGKTITGEATKLFDEKSLCETTCATRSSKGKRMFCKACGAF